MTRTPEPTLLEDIASNRPLYYWWFLAFILAICFSILSWTLCYTIFNKPEVPRNYELMRKLGMLPVHENYAEIEAPKLPTIKPLQLRNKFLALSDAEISTINNSLVQSYLTNYNKSTFCEYLNGSFKVLEARKLTNNDFIKQGFAVKLQAYHQVDEYTDITPYPVIAELIFPTHYSNSYSGYYEGDTIKLNITPHFASIIYATRTIRDDDDTIITITAVSLGSKITPPHQGSFDLSPPLEVNLKAQLPLFATE